jgi:hypothetical protein
MNELVCTKYDLGNYAILANSLAPKIKNVLKRDSQPNWRMHFNGAQFRIGVGARVVFTSSQGNINFFLIDWGLIAQTM